MADLAARAEELPTGSGVYLFKSAAGKVLFYADSMTDSIRVTLEETGRRREIQERYNAEHGITPTSIVKRISDLRNSIWDSDYVTVPAKDEQTQEAVSAQELPELIESLRAEMQKAAQELAYEQAADLRDRVRELEALRLRIS